MQRSAAISRLEYSLILNLQPGNLELMALLTSIGQAYEGRVTIEFDLQQTIPNLFVDYFGKKK